MKKSFIFAAAALVLFAACNKENVSPKEGLTLKASVEQHVGSADTKTALDGANVVWVSGDAIKVYNADGSANVDLTTTSAGTKADFSGGDLASGDPAVAIYPADAATGYDGTNITFTLPATQAHKNNANSFDPACNVTVGVVNGDGHIAFKNTFGLLKLSLKGVILVGKIELTGKNGEKLNGSFTVNPSAAEPIATKSGEPTVDEKTTTMTTISGVPLYRDKATDFYFVVPVSAFSSGFTAKVYDMSDNFAYSVDIDTDKNNTINRSKVRAMPAVKVGLLDSSAYQELEWIGSDSSAYIDTGVDSQGCNRIQSCFSYDSYVMYGAFWGNYILPNDPSNEVARAILADSENSVIIAHNCTQSSGKLIAMESGAFHNFSVYPESSAIYKDGNSIDWTYVRKADTPNTNKIALLNRAVGENSIYRPIGAKMQYFRLYNYAGPGLMTSKFYGIPCKRLADNEIGMFDLKSDTFVGKTNMDTYDTDFTAGSAWNADFEN